MSRTKNKRVKVKTFNEMAGRYIPKAIGGVGTFQYMAPSKPSGTTDMEQLGKALTKLGAVGLDYTDKQIDQRTISDRKSGVSDATKDNLKGLINSKKGIQDLIKARLIDKETSAPYRQAYLITLGETFAQGQHVKEHLVKDMVPILHEFYTHQLFEGTGGTDIIKGNKDFLSGKKNPEGASKSNWVGVDGYIDSILLERIKDLSEQVGPNKFVRDIGFFGKLEPAFKAARAEWDKTAKSIAAERNKEAVSQALIHRFQAGVDDPSQANAASFFFGKGHDSEDGTAEALKNLDGDLSHIQADFVYRNASGFTPFESIDNPRPYFFKQVESFALLLEKGEHTTIGVGADYGARCDAALNFIKQQESQKEPNTGRKVNAGEMLGSYEKLKKDIRARKAAWESAAQTKKEDGEVAVKDYVAILSQHKFIDKDKNPLTRDLHKLVTNIRNGDAYYLDEHGTPHTIKWEPRSKDNPLGPTQEVMDNWNTFAAIKGGLESLSSIRAAQAAIRTDKDLVEKGIKEGLTHAEAVSLNNLVTRLRADWPSNEKFSMSDPKARTAVNEEIVRLKKLYQEAETPFDEFAFREKAGRIQDMNLFEDVAGIPTPDARLGTLTRSVGENWEHLTRLMNNGPTGTVQVRAWFAKENFSGPVVEKFITELKDNQAKFEKLMTFHRVGTKTGFSRVLEMKKALLGEGSIGNSVAARGLEKYFRLARKNAKDRITIIDPYCDEEDLFHEAIFQQMEGKYTKLVAQTYPLVNYDIHECERLVHEQLYQLNDKPIVFTKKDGTEITLRENSIIWDLMQYPETSGVIVDDGEQKRPPKDWGELLDAIKHGKAIRGTRTIPPNPPNSSRGLEPRSRQVNPEDL